MCYTRAALCSFASFADNRGVFMTTEHLPFVLTAYSLPHHMGYLKTREGEANAAPLSVVDLMDAAAEWNLAGVLIPLTSRVP